jgi:hypothetical protein
MLFYLLRWPEREEVDLLCPPEEEPLPDLGV